MLKQSQVLTSQIHFLQTQINQLPSGKMFCTRNGSHYKWYHSDGKVQTYIPKKERSFAEQLAFKKYLCLKLQDLQQEKCAIDFYLRHHKPSQSEQLLSQNSEYQTLLAPYFQPLSAELLKWSQASYEQNQNHPEQLIHKTGSGHLVRSKSEALIDMMLYINRIPFRYECALELNSIILYPDFTIRHPKSGQIFYWEHFGLMDQPSYCKNTASKLQLYMSNQIIPSINLITTYETQEYPLTADAIEKIVQAYFL